MLYIILSVLGFIGFFFNIPVLFQIGGWFGVYYCVLNLLETEEKDEFIIFYLIPAITGLLTLNIENMLITSIVVMSIGSINQLIGSKIPKKELDTKLSLIQNNMQVDNNKNAEKETNNKSIETESEVVDNESGQKTPLIQNNIQNKTGPQSNKWRSKVEYIIGFIIGLDLGSIGVTIWRHNDFSFSPVIIWIIGIYFGIWLARKMMNNQKTYIRVIFWILFVIIITYQGYFIDPLLYPKSDAGNQNIKSLEIDRNPSNSQITGNLYRNEKYHFRIKFPEGWKIEEGNGPNVVQKAVSNNGETIVIDIQQFQLNGNKIPSIKDINSLDDFSKEYSIYISEQFSDSQIIDYGETKINNEPAYWAEYTFSEQTSDYQIKITGLTYILAKDDILYTIRAGALSENYQKVKPIFLQSIATFALENY